MKVTVFGATSAIGREIVDDLLFRGHEVIAHVGSLGEVPGAWAEQGVTVLVGPLSDAVTVEAAVAGGEAVINALVPRLGRGAHDAPLVEATRTIVESMHRHGLRRYIGLGSPAVVQCPKETPTVGTRTRRFLIRWLRPGFYRRSERMSRVVTNSGLDWTIVRFSVSSKAGPRGLKHVGFLGDAAVGRSATEADIARFTAAQVLDTGYIGAAPAVSN